jgi:pimeloyl-ACP methyl ester carboxylesterase
MTGLKMILVTLIFVVVTLAIIWAGLWILSPGKPEPFLDVNRQPLRGSISEKIFVTIGGIRQGMFIRGKSRQNPVLLYVHGGPAFPNYFLFDRYKPGLEEEFTVCFWEQRGGGLSYSREVMPESMTLEQLTSDAIEVTNYLRKRFKQEKIYLMAHSGGTSFTIQAAAQAPELYHAYIAMSQITRQSESEKIAYKWMLNHYLLTKDRKAVHELKKFPVEKSDTCIGSFYKSMIRDRSMHELGIGTMRSMRSVLTGVFIPVWTCSAYTIGEKWKLWESKFTFLKKTKLYDQLLALDIPSIVTRLEIPVYFMSGRYDFTVNHDLSKDYFEQLQAPLKRFYTFEESAHSPLFEEPDKAMEIIVNEILGGHGRIELTH